MKLSAKVEYACIAMVELARAYGTGEPVRIRSIGEANGVPSKFLVQLLIQLKNAGIVVSNRGACGGYRLSRDPREITLGDICAVIEGSATNGAAIDGQTEFEPNATINSPTVRVIGEIWTDLSERYQRRLDEITIAALADRAGQYSESMYYI